MKWLIQLALLLALLMFVRGVLRALFAPKKAAPNFKNPGPSRSRESKVKQGKMEKDPTCGTYVDVTSSLHRSFGGETKYFCSADCLEKFKQSHQGW